VLAWAIQELAEARTPAGLTHAPSDPAASWRLRQGSAGVGCPGGRGGRAALRELCKWCAARGELVLEEAKVLASLTVQGATMRTGSLSQVTIVVGVRVTA